MRWTKRTRGCLGAAVLAVAVVLAPLASASSATAATAVTGSATLAPDLLTSGRTAVYSATWTNTGNGTLTQVVAVITLHPGAALASPTPPPGCTATGSGPVVVSCPHDNLAAGATLTQQLLVTISVAGAIKAELNAKENTHDQDKSHLDRFPATDPTVKIVSDAVDDAGGCIKNGDQALATRPGLSAANPLITTATLAGPSGAPPCVPVSVHESTRTSPTEACGDGAKCTTDIAVTQFFSVFPDSPSSPVQLTFTVLTGNKNLTWYKNGQTVVECAGATSLPDAASACVNSRSKSGSTVRLGVLWREGPDPSWRGG